MTAIEKVKELVAREGGYPYLPDIEGYVTSEIVGDWRWGTILLTVIKVDDSYVGIQFRQGSGDSEGYEHEPDMWDYFEVEAVPTTVWRRKK